MSVFFVVVSLVYLWHVMNFLWVVDTIFDNKRIWEFWKYNLYTKLYLNQLKENVCVIQQVFYDK